MQLIVTGAVITFPQSENTAQECGRRKILNLSPMCASHYSSHETTEDFPKNPKMFHTVSK